MKYNLTYDNIELTPFCFSGSDASVEHVWRHVGHFLNLQTKK